MGLIRRLKVNNILKKNVGKHINVTPMADQLLEYSKMSDDRSPESTNDNSTQRHF